MGKPNKRTTYTQVRRTAVKSGFCPVCGKPVTRQRTFENTVNPFNRNELGAVRTCDEVLENVKQLCADWVPDFTHEGCKGLASMAEKAPQGAYPC